MSFRLLFDVARFVIVYLCVVAVLFWLNYKAAYDNWKEQRLALNSDIHMATKEVVDKLPAIQQTSVQAFSTLFLQLTVNDLGICLPITSATPVICAHRNTVYFSIRLIERMMDVNWFLPVAVFLGQSQYRF